MSNYVIIADAASNVDKALQERFNIDEVIKSTITLADGTSHEVSCDFDVISQEEFYTQIKSKKNTFSTAAPSPEYLISIFEKYVKDGKNIIFFTLSSALSATYQYAKVAADELNSKYESKVYVVDSHAYAASELLLVIQASKLKEEGKTFEEAIEKLENIKHCIHQAGPMDDLMFLARAGRISNGKAFMGTIVGVNPIGEVDREGLTKVLCKVKGSKKALEVSLKYVQKTIVDPSNQIVLIANSNRKEKAKQFEEMIRNEINPKEIISVDVGLFCAPNIGPGLCAAYYLGEEKSEDLSKETAIFNEILGK